ncbi:hypothetical protein OVY29_21765 [Sphingopyxis sp. SE2]|nr:MULTISPECIES: hypothetical protein [unclassified Sphingopyxis]MDT7531288.1 hypothetical protein [Sphingopyxis sp. SE2]
MVNTIGDSTRQLVADRIKMGGALDADIGRVPDRGRTTPPQQKERGR